MVAILYEPTCRAQAEQCAADLGQAFSGHITLELLEAGLRDQWSAKPSWDDLLVVLYNDPDRFPVAGERFIGSYLDQHGQGALVLPVAASVPARHPPGLAAEIKALDLDGEATGPNGRFAKRVGAMLGLRVQGRDASIFVSYRQKDGAAIAGQLEAHLRGLGYPVFLDQARELDGETKILPGSGVQAEIDAALAGANLVLLIDTPSAPESPWIRHEVLTADSLLLPILPLCFRASEDKKVGPRFRSLLSLQRWVSLPLPGADVVPPLTEAELDQIVRESELYICEIFRRKCRVPFLVQKEFVDRGFAWKVLDKRLLIFESSKVHDPRLTTKVSSHCSVFEPIYAPALKRFCTFLQDAGRGNYSLFIYDGDLLPDLELEALAQGQDDVILLHHQELAVLLDTNFQALRVS